MYLYIYMQFSYMYVTEYLLLLLAGCLYGHVYSKVVGAINLKTALNTCSFKENLEYCCNFIKLQLH